MAERHAPKRRPHNALTDPYSESPLSDPGVLSASPQSFIIERTQSLDALQDFENTFDLSRASPSAKSEIEVILDDGTTQKRTISLSTIPEQKELK